MSDTVIRVENLSKKYTIRHANGRSSAEGLRHAIQDAVATPLRAFRQFATPKSNQISISSSEDFHALRDVSFEVKRGEVLGIIGRNGAGKSTLLKILSRITEPTSGRIGIKGRVASLLEVGTGFHPELTGRENIYLNGAILGMSQQEVKRNFGEIVAFAEVEKFLDTPVKRYSSGMYVRLAFAVAAHLEPEILIVDEVLAVGDVQFQTKCLGKIKAVASGGRTVLFVTHNVALVPRLCTTCLLMQGGELTCINSPEEVVRRYLKGAGSGSLWVRKSVPAAPDFYFESVRICSQEGESQANFAADAAVIVELKYRVCKNNLMTRVGVELERDGGEVVFVSTDCDAERGGIDMQRSLGCVTIRCEIPPELLTCSTYHVTATASWTNHVEYDRVSRCVSFTISAIGSRTLLDKRPGIIAPILKWVNVGHSVDNLNIAD